MCFSKTDNQIQILERVILEWHTIQIKMKIIPQLQNNKMPSSSQLREADYKQTARLLKCTFGAASRSQANQPNTSTKYTKTNSR